MTGSGRPFGSSVHQDNKVTYRNVYLGSTLQHTYVYLGEDSANFAKFLYGKIGIDVVLTKTDIMLTTNEFAYLTLIKATIFKNTRDVSIVTSDIKAIMDAYDVCMKHGFWSPNGQPLHSVNDTDITKDHSGATKLLGLEPGATTNVKYQDLYHDKRGTIVMYNKQERISVVIPYSEVLPEYKDSVLTTMEWSAVAEYKPETLDKISDISNEKIHVLLENLFHNKIFKNYSTMYKKLCAFGELYIE